MTTEAMKQAADIREIDSRAMIDLLSYDQKTGEFRWSVNATKRVALKRAGAYDKHGCLNIKINGRSYMAHRIAWFFSYGKWPDGLIDHINGNPSDNRIQNLRDVTASVNQQNQRNAAKRNKTGLLGVCPKGSKWRAQIVLGGKKVHIGMYPTPEDAHRAYISVKRLNHEGSTI